MSEHEPNQVDLTDVTFDNFVLFLFDHEANTSEERNWWYSRLPVAYDADRICAYYIRLFRHPEPLRERFTLDQLEQGFWAALGPSLECSVSQIIHYSEEVPLTLRADCIRAMYSLFEKLFASSPTTPSIHMWWDVLCYDWNCGNRNRERGGADLMLQDVLFETLSAVLQIDSVTCQAAALHGLGHLHHPDTAELISRFIEQHSDLSSDMKEYALAASRFGVL